MLSNCLIILQGIALIHMIMITIPSTPSAPVDKVYFLGPLVLSFTI